MRIFLMIIAITFLCQCGIKGDPVPPTKPVKWGPSLKDKGQEKKSETENQ